MSRTNRRGFTLVEMLVVISIIGVLMSLALPAIQNAREKGRTVSCANNMRNVALALVSYESSNNTFPGFANSMPLKPTAAKAAKNAKTISYMIPLLPLLEQNGQYDIWRNEEYTAGQCIVNPLTNDKTVYVANFQCASDSAPDTLNPWTSYVCNTGCANDRNGNAYDNLGRREDGVFHNQITGGPAVGSAYISSNDGTTHTLMLSENVNAGTWAYKFVYDQDLPPSLDPVPPPSGGLGPSVQTNKQSHRLRTLTGFNWIDQAGTNTPDQAISRINSAKDKCSPPNPPTATNYGKIAEWTEAAPSVDDSQVQWAYARPSSRHTQGVNVAFCDGSVKFLNENIAYEVYRQLCTPYGKGATSSSGTRPGPLQDSDY